MGRRERKPLTPAQLEAKARYDAAIKEATSQIIRPEGMLDLQTATEVMDKAFEKHGFPIAFREKVSETSAQSIILLKPARDNNIARRQKRKTTQNREDR